MKGENEKKAPTVEDEVRRFLANVNRNLEKGVLSNDQCLAFAEVVRTCAEYDLH